MAGPGMGGGRGGGFFSEDEILGKAYDTRLIKRLIKYFRPFIGILILVLFITILTSAISVIWPVLLGKFIDGPFTNLVQNAGETTYTSEYVIFIALFLGYMSLTFLLSWGATFFSNLLGQKIIHVIRLELFSHIEHLSMRFFQKNPVGRLVTRVTSDIQVLNDLFTSGFVELLSDVAKIFAIITVMLIIDWSLALIVLAVTPFLLIFSWVMRNKIRTTFRGMRKKIAIINSFFAESFSGSKIIKVFCQEKKSYKKFDSLNEDYRNTSFKMITNFSIFAPMVSVFSTIAIAGLIYFGGMRLMNAAGVEIATNVFTFGLFTQFYFWTSKLFEPIRELAEKYNILQSAMASSERIFKIIDTEIEVKSGAYVPQKFVGDIEFKNIWFAYEEKFTDDAKEMIKSESGRVLPVPPTTPAFSGLRSELKTVNCDNSYNSEQKNYNWVLKDFSMKVNHGEMVAIVGSTGGGKSTIINLLMRFYDAQHGQILIDGVDIKEYDLVELRRKFALVIQDVLFFAGTIERNIKLGESRINHDDVEWAAEKVYAKQFIDKLPEKFDTELHEGGLGLSTGQRQLIAFARALAFDPEILILDEATANVDTESEEIIQTAMQEVLENRTAIVIAHRLSTIKSAKKIFVIHKGELRESGNHETLIKKSGIYAKLYELQSIENGHKPTS